MTFTLIHGKWLGDIPSDDTTEDVKVQSKLNGVIAPWCHTFVTTTC